VWRVVREEAGRGAAVVLTTHSFEEAERVADRIVIMAAGQVVADGTLEQVRGDGSLEEVYFSLTDGGAR
jgi:ABC-2 type transport system ATP-binding protein